MMHYTNSVIWEFVRVYNCHFSAKHTLMKLGTGMERHIEMYVSFHYKSTCQILMKFKSLGLAQVVFIHFKIPTESFKSQLNSMILTSSCSSLSFGWGCCFWCNGINEIPFNVKHQILVVWYHLVHWSTEFFYYIFSFYSNVCHL